MNILSKCWHLTSITTLFRPLDWVILVSAVLVIVGSFSFWTIPQQKLRVQIYQEGELYREVDLAATTMIAVKGPLGVTQVQVQRGKVRIIKDPSPRQYCVQKGWLYKAGQIAICLPNHTSIFIVGGSQTPLYDSLHY